MNGAIANYKCHTSLLAMACTKSALAVTGYDCVGTNTSGTTTSHRRGQCLAY